MASLLIKGGRIVDPVSKIDKKADLLVGNSLIAKIGENITTKADGVIDASGMVVVPGFIDSHVHLREPGFEDLETIASGSRAAIAGGITSVVCMPNTNPIVDDPSVIDLIKEKQEEANLADIYPVAALTKNSAGKELSEMFHLAEAGAIAFSDDGKSVDNGLLMRRALEYSTLVKKPVLIHAEDKCLANGGQVNEGLIATKLGLKGIPALAEEAIIFRDIELAKLTGAQIHFLHVSTANSVELIRKAKKEGLPVTCEVTPHHLLLDESNLTAYDTNYKVKPPLRSEADRKELLKGLVDGTIDCIASDHAPHAQHEKEKEFDYAAFGIAGLETLFSLIYAHFEKDLGLAKLIEKMTVNPATIFNIEAGALKESKRADVTIFNPKAKVKVDSSAFYSKSKNTPFDGWELKSKIEYVIKDGKIVFKEGKVNSPKAWSS